MVQFRLHILALAMLGSVTCSTPPAPARQWLAGDSHVHSHWSPTYDASTSPPAPVRGGDASYSTPTNAGKAREHGLSWMVTTDHGGPNHSKYNLTEAYPELTASRDIVPDLLQFYGMEINMPGMDHHTLILPRTADESSVLFDIESRFDANEAWPRDPNRNTAAAALKALAFMEGLARVPLVFANHPARSATAIGAYGLDTPEEFRHYHDVAPRVYHGMEGAPGHQAAGISPNDSVARSAGLPPGHRGYYLNPGAPTLGGFDQMTAVVGGVWDSLLGEGRRFWVLATSDSHRHYADPSQPGADFWPGEFHKTYVWAAPTYDDVIDGLRGGRIFVAAGDLIDELDVTAVSGGRHAAIGGTLRAERGEDVALTIRFREPAGPNASGHRPRVHHVDVIVGDVRGPVADRHANHNDTTRVIARLGDGDWQRDGGTVSMTVSLPAADRRRYVRVRGTSTTDLDPHPDEPWENPWLDLWFYSNPIFIDAP